MELDCNKTRIAVIGGGNIGTQFACKCSSKGYKVNLCSSKPELFDGSLEIIDENNNIIRGNLASVSSNIGDTIADCGIIFVTYPAFKLKDTAEQILDHISGHEIICVLPGTGGAEFAFQKCIKKGATLCGLQRVPSVARIEKYGKRVRCEGLRSELFLSSIPGYKAKEISDFITNIWEIPCNTLPNYLSVTLIPSNQILHTTRLKTLFENYKEGVLYPNNPLFYGDWNDYSSSLLLACDDELQQMLKMLDCLDLHYIKSLKEHYESNTIKEMTSKISSIKSLHNLLSPMKKVENGWIPDFNSRFFAADFPYGLAIIEAFADILGVEATNIRNTMNWYRKVSGDNTHYNLNDYGIRTKEDIYKYYMNTQTL